MILFTLAFLFSFAPASQQTGYFYFSGIKPAVEPVVGILIEQHDCRRIPLDESEIWIVECPAGTAFPDIPTVHVWQVTADPPLSYRNGEEAVKTLATSEVLSERIAALRYLTLHPRAWKLRSVSPEFLDSIAAADRTLREWNAAARAIEGYAGGEMYDLSAGILTGLAKVQFHGIDRLVLLHATKVPGEFPVAADNGWLRKWLGWWGARIQEVKHLPESASWESLQPMNWRGRDFPNTDFPNLQLRGRTFTVEPRTQARTLDLYLDDRDPSWPLALLGIESEAEEAKKEILSFISRQDETVAQNLGKFERSYQFAEFTRQLQLKDKQMDLARRFFLSAIEAEDLSEQSPQTWRRWETVRQGIFREAALGPFNGHHLIHRLIDRIGKPNTAFARIPAFDPRLHTASRYEILTALIAERRTRLHTQGAYLAALDAAIGMQNRLRETADGRAILRSRGMRARDEALTLAIRAALIKPLPRLPRAACEIMMSPQTPD